MIRAVVLHKAGENPTELAQSKAGTALPAEGIYSATKFHRSNASQAMQHALQVMNQAGGQEGHVISMANDMEQGDVFCVVYNWSAILEDQIDFDLRPKGCADCTIF